MQQWNLFLVSFGCLLILLSYQMPNPILLILSGVILTVFGWLRIRKDKK